MINSFLRKTAIAFLIGGLTLFVWSGCNNSEEVGLNLTTPGERFHYVIDSSAQVQIATLRQDSLTSEKRTSSLLGCMNDPVFGRTYAHLLTQLRLSSNEVEFGAGATLDSAMILMKYQTWYGDTTTLQEIKIYELLKDIYVDSTYYSNLDVNGFYDPASPVGTFSYRPTPDRDSVLIKLNDDFGQRLLDTDTAYLSSNVEWLKYMRGLYLEAQTTDQNGSIISYNFSGGKSRLTLYYHNDVSDSLKYEIVINSNSTWVNLFSHDYSQSTFGSQINDSVYTHPQAFLQGASGVRAHVKITFPDSVLALLESGVAVNKAELIFKAAPDAGLANFERPKTLRVFNAKTNGTNEFIDDLALGEVYYGGIYDEQTGSYSFNIGRHVQNLLHPDPLQRKANTGLFLVLSEERTSAARLILDNAPGSVQLILTYTPLQ